MAEEVVGLLVVKSIANRFMKNNTLAIFGIVAYILSVFSSATDLEGKSTTAVALILISGIATAVFIIMAILRLWKEARGTSITLMTSTFILLLLTAIQEFALPLYGSPIIILLNIVRVIYFITIIWTIVKLFKLKNHKE